MRASPSPAVGPDAVTPEDQAEESAPATDRPARPPADLPPPLKEAEQVQPAAPPPTPATDAASDSLEFLDVDTDVKQGEPTPEPKVEAVPMPPDAAEQLGDGSGSKSPGASVGAAGVTSFSTNAEQPKKGVAKTLKCGECGAMNLPTEWYCERCGAELAAL